MATKKKTPARKTSATRPAPKKAISKVKGKRSTKPSAGKSDVPQLFRLNIEVGNLEAAANFYTELLGVQGRPQRGARVYFDCGPVTLQVVDVSSVRPPHPAAKALYFTVRDLEAAFARAKGLGCLSQENVHDEPGGGVVVRPWGERSFYAEDAWGNPLCFVEEGTVYVG
jgi:catechol 2,3-dioxygenase-like lactoylglutathione lyase family enzyme